MQEGRVQKGKGRTMVAIIIFCTLGVLSVLYGISIMMVQSGTRFFLVWYVLGAVFFALAICSRFGVWANLPVIARRVISVVLVLVLAFFVLVECFVASGFGAQVEPGLDYIIVLGAQVKDDGPSVVLKFRLDKAYEYLEESPNTICIVSGGQGRLEPFPEAEGMADYLVSRGIDRSRIIEEDQSKDTKQNIENSMKLFDYKNSTVGIVTSNFHVYRGVQIARKSGIGNAVGIAADSVPWYNPNNMFREFFGVCKDLVFGNMNLIPVGQ